MSIAATQTFNAARVFRTWRAFAPALSLIFCILSLPPFGYWPLAFVQWIPLLYWCATASGLQAAFAGAVTGAAFGAYIYFGAAVLDVQIWVVASVALGAVYAAFFGLVPILVRHAGPAAPCALGALWASAELLLEALHLPFSMALILTPAPMLLQAATLGGPSLVVALVVASQSACVRLALPNARMAHVRVGLAIVMFAAALTLLGNAHRPPADGALSVAALQSDLHPFVYVYAEADGHLAQLREARTALEAALGDSDADLVVWPEVPFARFDLRGTPSDRPTHNRASLVAGNDFARDGRQFNAVMGIDAAGRVRSRHVKSVLLPRLEAKYSDTSAIAPHRGLPGTPGSLVCFESAFSTPARTLSRNGAMLLTIATSDAYAGPSLLPALHARFSILRAIENRRAVVRAANGGPSMIVDERGRVLAQRDLFESGVVEARIALISAPTLYAQHATLIHFFLLVIGLLPVPLAARAAQHPDLHFPATRAGILAVSVALTLCLALGFQTVAIGQRFSNARAQTERPELGFGNTLDTRVSYAELSSAIEREDLAAAVAATLRRFGIAATTQSVERRRLELSRTSIFRVDAQALFADHELLTERFDPTVNNSIIPCVATLRDGSTVLISKLAPDAAEIFSPAEAAYSNVPRSFLNRSLRDTPTCVIGRAFSWDLEP